MATQLKPDAAKPVIQPIIVARNTHFNTDRNNTSSSLTSIRIHPVIDNDATNGHHILLFTV